MMHVRSKNSISPIWLLVLAVFLGYVLWPSLSEGGKISPKLDNLLSTSKQTKKIPVIVNFSDRVDLSIYKAKGKQKSRTRKELVRALKEKATNSQKETTDFLSARGISKGKTLWNMESHGI
jgi:hypothetical protein